MHHNHSYETKHIIIRPSYSNNQFYVTEEEEKGKGVVGKFSFRIVCQNHIPFSLVT